MELAAGDFAWLYYYSLVASKVVDVFNVRLVVVGFAILLDSSERGWSKASCEGRQTD